MSGHNDIGVIGLGVMGQNLAANMADKGFSVAVFDPWAAAREAFATSDFAAIDRITPTSSLADFIAGLAPPRVILMMVKAGGPVDDLIAAVTPLLAAGDTLIDGGNSHFRDTGRRRARLRDAGLRFIGLGVSGGEEGARHGPALMAGGAPDSFDRAKPVLNAIAATVDGAPCCAYFGEDGAGHLVKTIHNGIEYAIMQIIAETYVLLRDLGGFDHPAMAAVFRSWNDTAMGSYLLEITADILETADDLAPGPLVEAIRDTAGQKGTGRWSSEIALEFGIPAPTIAEAVAARSLAALYDDRQTAASALGNLLATDRSIGSETLVANLGDALRGAVLCAYAQGFAIIRAAAMESGWQTDLSLVARTWRAGCIIRARVLDDFAAAFAADGDLVSLLVAPAMVPILATAQAGWRRTVADAVRAGIPVPCLGSALAYFDGYRSAKLWANMIQAPRDCFGAHTYERLDRPGVFHSKWGPA